MSSPRVCPPSSSAAPSRRDTWRLASVATRHTSTSVLLLNLPLRFGSTRLPADRCFSFFPLGFCCVSLGIDALFWVLLQHNLAHPVKTDSSFWTIGASQFHHLCNSCSSTFIVFTVWICEMLWPLDLDRH